MSSRPVRRHRLVWLSVVLVGLAALHAATLAYHASATIAFPYDLDYGEGYVLNDAVRLARGESIYVDIQQFPMVRSPYPPLYPALWALVVPFAGPVFWPGRLLAALCLAGITAVVFASGWRVRVGLVPAIVATGVVVASPLIYQWAAYARVDTLAVLASVSAVAVAQWVPGRRGILVAGLLCLVALWTKQSAIAAPAAIALALFARSPGQALTFGAVIAIPSVLIGATLDRATSGQFVRHVLHGNAQNPIFPARLVVMYGTFAALHLPLIAAATLWALRAIRGIASPIALYVPISLLFALTVGNGGSSVNYFIEPIAACALALPFAWRALPSHRAGLAPALALAQLLLLSHWPNTFGTDYLFFAPHGRTPTAADYAVGARVDAAVRAEPREIIAEPAGFAVRNGRPVLVQPIDLRAEAFLGRWDSTLLMGALQTGRIGLVITSYNLLPFDVERLIDSPAFREDGEFGGDNGLRFRLLRPAGL